MKIAIYPGCMVLARFQEYELASRKVLEQLGYEIVELGEFCCCGASLLPGVTDNWVNLTAYTLALAEKAGTDIVTLCGNCTNNFKRVNSYFEGDHKVRDEINSTLGKLDLVYGGSVKVNHLIEVLYGKREQVAGLVKRKIDARVAVSHPCQVLRPKGITGIEDPNAFRRILEVLRLDIIDYPEEHECCGATALLFNEKMGIRQGRSKLESCKAHGANLVAAACGNCLFLLDRLQNKIFKENKELKIPVTALSQLVAFSFGFDDKSLSKPFTGSKVPRSTGSPTGFRG